MKTKVQSEISASQNRRSDPNLGATTNICTYFVTLILGAV